MEPEQRQRIIGYFLEETQEYLELLEPGMDDLENALTDEERINELYRAAHSIKGGAAMLELDGIQKVAYRLESSLKFMKSNPVNTSREIEAKLLRGVLGIKRLVGEVRETQDISDASATEVWSEIEPTFDGLDQELQAQVDNAVTEAGAAGDSAELPAIELDTGNEAAAASDLDELSWDDIDDLTNLGDDNATPSLPQTTEASGSIDGLDALANLFDENPLSAEDSLAWDQEATLPSADNALKLDDFDLEGLEASLEDSSDQEGSNDLDDLLADPLLGDDLLGTSAATPASSSSQADADFEDLFGDSDELSLSFEPEADGADGADGAAASAIASSDLDNLDAELDALGLEDGALSDFADEAAGDQSTDFNGDLLGLDDLNDSLGTEATTASADAPNADQPQGETDVDLELDLGLDLDPELSEGLGAEGDLDLSELAEGSEVSVEPDDAIATQASPEITTAPTEDAPDMDTHGDFSAALDEELTEADTWVSEETEAEQQSAAEEHENLEAQLPSLEETGSELESLTASAADETVKDVPTSSDDVLADDDGLVDIVDFAAELDAELESDLVGDMNTGALDLDADEFLNSLESSGEEVGMNELDEFLDSTTLDPGQNPALGNLDSLLDEMASSEVPAVTPSNQLPEDDFDDLDSLLSTDAPTVAPPAKADDFSDMEKLLQGTESLAGPAGGASRSNAAAAPPAKTRSRSQRLREQSMRVPIKTLDNFNNLVGEMVVNRNSLEGDQDRLKQSLEKLTDHTQKLSDVGQKLQDLYERSLLENALLNSRRKVMGESTGTAGSNGVNLSASNPDSDSAVGDLDDLELDKFTGFHTLSQDIIELIVRVRESASDIDFLINESLDQDTRNFRQTTSQLQEEVNRSRMVPFAQTADRLPRAVRDIAHKCGKSARLTIEGRDTLIDKMLIEQLHDPLTHLINNAVTHGIETQEERIMNGKSGDGSIHLQAFYQGNQTVISVADDGAGIDPEQIKRKAIEKGLVRAEDAEQLGVSQLYDFLFHAGFSTRSQADAFAGRGVGMDVVRTRLQELRGTVVIDSEIGKGTTFTIRLPLTLSITKALQCISNRARIAFPLDGVEDMFDIPKDQIANDAEGNQTIQWRDMMLPVRELSELLRYNRIIGRSSVYAGNADDDMAALVILRSAGEYLAVNVDRTEGEMDIVIKQLEGPVPKPTGIAGATVLSDGQVMPIADVLELIDISKGRTRQGAAAALWEEEQDAAVEEPVADNTSSEPMVLIVDDSITVRELLSMSFAKAGYRVEQARDGQEAWEKLRSGLPCDLIFCDIEMPRMTGLELLEKLQEDEVLKQLPMSMLTSRGADKHRKLAAKLGAKGYFTKPYLEEALLEAANKLLNGEVLLQLEGV